MMRRELNVKSGKGKHGNYCGSSKNIRFSKFSTVLMVEIMVEMRMFLPNRQKRL